MCKEAEMLALEKEPEWHFTKRAFIKGEGDVGYLLYTDGPNHYGNYEWSVTICDTLRDMQVNGVAGGNNCASLNEATDCTEIALLMHLDDKEWCPILESNKDGKPDPRGKHQHPPYDLTRKGWACKKSPTGKCEYEDEFGEDECIHCGETDERK